MSRANPAFAATPAQTGVGRAGVLRTSRRCKGAGLESAGEHA